MFLKNFFSFFRAAIPPTNKFVGFLAEFCVKINKKIKNIWLNTNNYNQWMH